MAKSRPTPAAPARAETAATLPTERAFVVQVRSNADLERGVVAGRVEHVVSGAATPFESLQHLVDFMRDAVAGCSRPSPR